MTSSDILVRGYGGVSNDKTGLDWISSNKFDF